MLKYLFIVLDSAEVSTNLQRIIYESMQLLRSNRLDVPEEMSDLIFSLNTVIAQPLISFLNLSDETLLHIAQKYTAKVLPGLVLYNSDEEHLPKLSNNSHWMLTMGRLISSSVRVAILIPGIAISPLLKKNERQDKSRQIKNEFEMLLNLQKAENETHLNIARLLAFNPSPSLLHFHVTEYFQTHIIDKVIQSRSRQENLSEEWMNSRLVEIASAISYLHKRSIIHRDITLNSFALKTISADHEIAVLCTLEMACTNDIEESIPIGHITGTRVVVLCFRQVSTFILPLNSDKSKVSFLVDIYGENIPTRWSAPESLWDGKFDSYSDVWMFGHVIYAIFTHGCEPYTELYSETTDDIMARVLSCGLKPYKWPCVPLSYHNLASSCMRVERLNRPNMQSVRQQLLEFRQENQQKYNCKYQKNNLY